MTVTLPQELAERAHAVRLDAEALLAALTEAIERREADQNDQEIQHALQGIKRGYADAEAGRVKPLTQVITEARRRHNLPDNWPKDYVDNAEH